MSKKKLSKPPLDPKQFGKELYDDNDRTAVIVGTAYIDDLLCEFLKNWMLPSPTSGFDDLLDSERPLSSFSSRIRLAYRLRLIDKGMAEALHCIRQLRNLYAHWATIGNLDDNPQNELVADLFTKYRAAMFVQEHAKELRQDDPKKCSKILRSIIASTTMVLASGLKELDNPEPKFPLTLDDSSELKALYQIWKDQQEENYVA